MKLKLFITIFCSLLFLSVFGQDNNLKEKALEEFKKENYPKAIKLLETALKESPNDPDIYYYLGFFIHYNAYDTRPLAGYNTSYSDTVFSFLDKAIELNPNHGDAKYFYAAEAGAASLNAVKMKDFEKFKYFYEKAYNKGAFPDWAIEYGKITLDLCKKDAILFTHGDFILNICWYLQTFEEYRTDISVVPLALMDRPWFAMEVKQGNMFTSVEMSISENQLIDMHPYKWDTTTIEIKVPTLLNEKYDLPLGYKMEWIVEPDFSSSRVVSKISGEEAKPRTYLSAQRALLLDIVEANHWQRPIYFTAGFENFYLAGLNQYFQNCGLVSKLLPFKSIDTDWEFDIESFEKLVFEVSYINYSNVIETNQPRISGMLNSYKTSFWYLTEYYKNNGETTKLDNVINEFKSKMIIGFDSEYEQKFLEALEKFKN